MSPVVARAIRAPIYSEMHLAPVTPSYLPHQPQRCSVAAMSAQHFTGRRSLLLTALIAGGALLPPMPSSARSACNIDALDELPERLNALSKAGIRGDWKGAKAVIDEPAFGETTLTSAFEACAVPADGDASQSALRALSNLREEITYQTAKGVPDADDQADLLSCARKTRSALQKLLASVPEEKRGPGR